MDTRLEDKTTHLTPEIHPLNLQGKIRAIADLIRLSKQYGTLLLLLPTLWSLMLASEGRPPLSILLIFVAGCFLMRSAGCVVNDMADMEFDRFVERTKTRPLASGRLTRKEAFLVFLVLSLAAFSLVLLLLNRLTILLSFVAIALAVVYPFVKRVSHLPQLVLGVAFGWGAIMAWAAVRETVELPAILIFLANVCWSTAYDTIYALMDIDDDRRIGVKSTAILFGRHVYTITLLFFAGTILFLALLGVYRSLGPFYFSGLSIGMVVFILQVYMVKRSPDRDTAFKAFVSNVIAGSIILLGLSLDLSFY